MALGATHCDMGPGIAGLGNIGHEVIGHDRANKMVVITCTDGM